MSKRKYERGEHILTLDELAKQEFIYMDHKVYHRGWFGSWQFRLMAGMVGANGRLYYAIKKEEEMQRFYYNENTGAVLNQADYDSVPHHNPMKENYVYLGEFIDKSQARRYLYQTYLRSEASDEN